MAQSNEPSIAQMNVAIASFEGRKFYGRHTIDKYGEGTGNILPEMKYHTSWDWLMPVYHKIREIAFKTKDQEASDELFGRINSQLIFGTIADVHLHIYKFINWLNQQITTNGTDNR